MRIILAILVCSMLALTASAVHTIHGAEQLMSKPLVFLIPRPDRGVQPPFTGSVTLKMHATVYPVVFPCFVTVQASLDLKTWTNCAPTYMLGIPATDFDFTNTSTAPQMFYRAVQEATP